MSKLKHPHIDSGERCGKPFHGSIPIFDIHTGNPVCDSPCKRCAICFRFLRPDEWEEECYGEYLDIGEAGKKVFDDFIEDFEMRFYKATGKTAHFVREMYESIRDNSEKMKRHETIKGCIPSEKDPAEEHALYWESQYHLMRSQYLLAIHALLRQQKAITDSGSQDDVNKD